MTITPELSPFIDSTMMGAFRACPQKFYAEFCLGLRPVDLSVDLHAGGCFSHGLETFYRSFWESGVDVPTALARAYGAFDAEWGDFTPTKKTAKTRENVWAAIERYVGQFPPQTDPVQPFFLEGGKPTVEFSFAVPLEPVGPSPDIHFPIHPITGEPWIYSGRADLLGQHAGTICVRDEKTAGRLESNWSDKWSLRSQFIGYCWVTQSAGLRCNKAVVRGIILTMNDIRIVEAIKIYPQFLIERWHEQLRRDLWRLTQAWNEGYFDFNLNETCTNYGGCAFLDRCTSKDPNQFNSSYVVRRWNPLAKNPIGSPSSGSPTGTSLPSPAAKVAVSGRDVLMQTLRDSVTMLDPPIT